MKAAERTYRGVERVEAAQQLPQQAEEAICFFGWCVLRSVLSSILSSILNSILNILSTLRRLPRHG